MAAAPFILLSMLGLSLNAGADDASVATARHGRKSTVVISCGIELFMPVTTRHRFSPEPQFATVQLLRVRVNFNDLFQAGGSDLTDAASGRMSGARAIISRTALPSRGPRFLIGELTLDADYTATKRLPPGTRCMPLAFLTREGFDDLLNASADDAR